MKKWRKRLIIAAVIVGLVYLVPIPIPVNKTMKGYVFDVGEEAQGKKAAVELKGIYWLYLLRDDAYSGDMEITGGGFTEFDLTRRSKSKLQKIRFSYDGGGYVEYSNPDIYPGFGTHSLGFMEVRGCMGRIRLHLPTEKDKSQKYLVAPVQDREGIEEFMGQWAKA